MARRIEGKIEAILSEDQFGFRKHMGTWEAILALRGRHTPDFYGVLYRQFFLNFKKKENQTH